MTLWLQIIGFLALAIALLIQLAPRLGAGNVPALPFLNGKNDHGQIQKTQGLSWTAFFERLFQNLVPLYFRPAAKPAKKQKFHFNKKKKMEASSRRNEPAALAAPEAPSQRTRKINSPSFVGNHATELADIASKLSKEHASAYIYNSNYTLTAAISDLHNIVTTGMQTTKSTRTAFKAICARFFSLNMDPSERMHNLQTLHEAQSKGHCLAVLAAALRKVKLVTILMDYEMATEPQSASINRLIVDALSGEADMPLANLLDVNAGFIEGTCSSHAAFHVLHMPYDLSFFKCILAHETFDSSKAFGFVACPRDPLQTLLPLTHAILVLEDAAARSQLMNAVLDSKKIDIRKTLDSQGRSALLYAIIVEREQEFALLLNSLQESGPFDPNIPEIIDGAPQYYIHAALAAASPVMVETLLSLKGINPSVRSSFGLTPLEAGQSWIKQSTEHLEDAERVNRVRACIALFETHLAPTLSPHEKVSPSPAASAPSSSKPYVNLPEIVSWDSPIINAQTPLKEVYDDLALIIKSLEPQSVDTARFQTICSAYFGPHLSADELAQNKTHFTALQARLENLSIAHKRQDLLDVLKRFGLALDCSPIEAKAKIRQLLEEDPSIQGLNVNAGTVLDEANPSLHLAVEIIGVSELLPLFRNILAHPSFCEAFAVKSVAHSSGELVTWPLLRIILDIEDDSTRLLWLQTALEARQLNPVQSYESFYDQAILSAIVLDLPDEFQLLLTYALQQPTPFNPNSFYLSAAVLSANPHILYALLKLPNIDVKSATSSGLSLNAAVEFWLKAVEEAGPEVPVLTSAGRVMLPTRLKACSWLLDWHQTKKDLREASQAKVERFLARISKRSPCPVAKAPSSNAAEEKR